MAKELGATHTINSKIKNSEQEIIKILGGNQLDVFIDNTGIPSIIEMGYRVLKLKGKDCTCWGS